MPKEEIKAAPAPDSGKLPLGTTKVAKNVEVEVKPGAEVSVSAVQVASIRVSSK